MLLDSCERSWLVESFCEDRLGIAQSLDLLVPRSLAVLIRGIAVHACWFQVLVVLVYSFKLVAGALVVLRERLELILGLFLFPFFMSRSCSRVAFSILLSAME